MCDSKAGNSRLMALFDQAPGAASALAESLGLETQATDSIEIFLANPDIEFVVEIASPNARTVGVFALYAGSKMEEVRRLIAGLRPSVLDDLVLIHTGNRKLRQEYVSRYRPECCLDPGIIELPFALEPVNRCIPEYGGRANVVGAVK